MNNTTIRTITRNTRLKDRPAYEERMLKVAKSLKLDISIFQNKTSNWIFHVDVELKIIVECADGQTDNLEVFESLIDTNC